MFNLHSRYFLKELFYRWGRGLRVRWEIGSITCSRSSSGKLSEFKSTCSNHCCVLEKFQMPILSPEMLISFPVLQVYYSTLLCFLIDIHYFPSSAVRSMVSSKSSSLGPSPCLFIDSAQLNDPVYEYWCLDSLSTSFSPSFYHWVSDIPIHPMQSLDLISLSSPECPLFFKLL